MKYSFNILAAALAVGLFTLPAYAAVSDVEGGEIHVNTTINKHYNEIHYNSQHGRGDQVKVVDETTAGDTKGGTTYVGNLTYKAWLPITSYWKDEGYEYWKDSEGWHTTIFNFTNENPSRSDLIEEMRYKVAHWSDNDSRTNINVFEEGNGNHFYVGEDTIVRSNPGSISYGAEVQDYHTDVLDRIESSRTVRPEAGSIMIGDPDAIASAYAAHKDVTVDEVVDKYYNRHIYYKKEKIVHEGSTVYQVNATRYFSPIILDLDGDGKIEASNGQYLAHDTFSDKVAMFDFFDNGFPVLTEWVGANDGLLCRPTKDGKVTGAQLFGTSNGMDNGYEKMASLDADNSGALEGAELEGLYVWTDLNGNAIADKGELKTVQELGITSIKVTHNNFASTFERNGQTYRTFDWWPNCREMRKVNIAGIFE